MTARPALRVTLLAAVLALSPLVVHAQQVDAGTREAIRARREARREAAAAARQDADDPVRNNKAIAERQRVEHALRQALARAVRQRLNLNDDQANKLMDVNRRFGDERLTIARNEMRIRRELRRSLAAGDSSRSPATARLLDELLESQRQRLDVQQKEQAALSEFLTPGQRARYIAMMEQLRRRIQERADSARGGTDPEE
ncbi:MAG: hypothetical protein IT355_03225 [Gemmatimonadaceae bacterium]|nr:hypothetical protein [Gemmatimonadaceae bacterium]